MNLKQLINKLKTEPSEIQFEDTMTVIDELYHFSETSFTNGDVTNNAGENSGSCRVFSFAQLNDFDEATTLSCFGQYYREVMESPNGETHQNIRQFMQHGWPRITFSKQPLSLK